MITRVGSKKLKANTNLDRALNGTVGKDITVVDPKTLKEEGKIELSKPAYAGMGALRVRGADFFESRNADAYRMFYTMSDPVKKNRSIFGS